MLFLKKQKAQGKSWWGRYCFQFVCQFTSRGGGTPVRSRGYPIPSLAGGVPHPRSGRGGYPLPLTRSGWGTPLDLEWGTPWTWDGVPPGPGMGYPPDLGWGTPRTWDGVPPQTWGGVPPQTWDGVPPQTWDGVPPRTWDGVPPPTWDIASTCYAAGGMPLAFTQEDFLVFIAIILVYSIFFMVFTGRSK